MKLRFWQYTLCLMGVESLAALIYMILHPWSLYKGDLISWSIPQVICITFCMGATLFFFILSLRLVYQAKKVEPVFARIESRLVEEDKPLIPFTMLLVLYILIMLSVSLVFTLPQARFLHAWLGLYLQVIPGIALSLVITAQSIVYLLWEYRKCFLTKEYYSMSKIWSWLAIFLILSLSIFHWAMLFGQIDIFGLIPGWFWKFHQHPDEIKPGILLLVNLGLTLVTVITLFTPGAVKQKFFILIIAGFALQAGYGFVAGNGFDVLRLKFANSMHKVYAEFACDRPQLFQALWNYEQEYGWNNYLGTKPPGVLLVYVVTQKISAVFFPAQNFADRFLNMTRWMSFVYPAISMTVLFPLYRISRSFLPEGKALYPLLLYIVCPNVVLIPLFLDQVLYPALFMAGLWFLYLSLKHQSAWGYFLCGIYCYACLYFTFSMLPLVPLALIWLTLDVCLIKKFKNLRTGFSMAAAFGMGLILAYGILRIGLNYDIIQRYQTAMEHHRVLKIYQPGVNFLLMAIFLNQIDFASWTGFNICLLAFARFVRVVERFQKKFSNIEILVLSAFLTYGALNLFGQTRGEVGRIWIFMVPLICLFAVDEVHRLFKRERAAIAMLVLMQSVTTLAIFLFQDFFA